MIIPGELMPAEGEIVLNAGRDTLTLEVSNSGDRPIQVGSHYHFAETNAALQFDRAAARGMRLNIPAGTAVRFEPGQARTIELVAFAGKRRVYGFNAAVMGPLDRAPKVTATAAKGRKAPAAKAAAPARAKAAKSAAGSSTGKAPATKRAVRKTPSGGQSVPAGKVAATAKAPAGRKATAAGKAAPVKKAVASKATRKGAAR